VELLKLELLINPAALHHLGQTEVEIGCQEKKDHGIIIAKRKQDP
jgi:hypothetical protein